MFYSFAKNRELQTSPLKMNLVPEIQMDQKRNLEILPSALLLLIMYILLQYDDSIAPYTS
jgi:hypothetical protein